MKTQILIITSLLLTGCMGYGVIDIERYRVPNDERLITVPITYQPQPSSAEDLKRALQF
ncbi:MAG: hypothetical protein NZ824_04710 [Candidatus Thioglobus sp.]|nr:hypothetical protein [Candidatus Thioglobus sp.]